MKILVLDTSYRFLAVALYIDDQPVESRLEEGSRTQSERAIPVIEEVLEAHGLGLLDLDRIVVTRGPGSYTGVRVGLTIAKTLKAVHAATEVIMISTLAAYAGIKGKYLSVMDARSKKVYVGVYSDGQSVCPETIILLEEFADFAAQYPDYVIVGDTQLVGAPEQNIDWITNIYELSLLSTPVQDVHALVPTYIKEVEAKQQWHP